MAYIEFTARELVMKRVIDGGLVKACFYAGTMSYSRIPPVTELAFPGHLEFDNVNDS